MSVCLCVFRSPSSRKVLRFCAAPETQSCCCTIVRTIIEHTAQDLPLYARTYPIYLRDYSAPVIECIPDATRVEIQPQPNAHLPNRQLRMRLFQGASNVCNCKTNPNGATAWARTIQVLQAGGIRWLTRWCTRVRALCNEETRTYSFTVFLTYERAPMQRVMLQRITLRLSCNRVPIVDGGSSSGQQYDMNTHTQS